MRVMTSDEIKEYRDSLVERAANECSSENPVPNFFEQSGFYDRNKKLKKEFIVPNK